MRFNIIVIAYFFHALCCGATAGQSLNRLRSGIELQEDRSDHLKNQPKNIAENGESSVAVENEFLERKLASASMSLPPMSPADFVPQANTESGQKLTPKPSNKPIRKPSRKPSPKPSASPVKRGRLFDLYSAVADEQNSTIFPTMLPSKKKIFSSPINKASTEEPTISSSPTMNPVTKEPTTSPTKMPVTMKPFPYPVKKPVIVESILASTKLPVPKETLLPTNMPVTKKPLAYPIKRPSLKVPVTKDPTTLPTKNPVTKKPIISTIATRPVTVEVYAKNSASPTALPVKVAPIPVSASSFTIPTETELAAVQSTMVINSSIAINFNATFINSWEQTTSKYINLYYQNKTEVSNLQFYTRYDSYKMIDKTRYMISYTLYVQHNFSYEYSFSQATQTAKEAFSSKTAKQKYDAYVLEKTGYNISLVKATISSSAPTLSPVKRSSSSTTTKPSISPVAAEGSASISTSAPSSSPANAEGSPTISTSAPSSSPVNAETLSTISTSAPSSSPVAATVIKSTVEGSMNFTYSPTTAIVFSDEVIPFLENATGIYITNYHRYNANVENLQVTVTYQDSITSSDCECASIVYFSFAVSYTYSALTVDELLTKPFDSKVSKMAYDEVLIKLGIQVHLASTSFTDQDPLSRASSFGSVASSARNIHAGLLALVAGAMGCVAVLLV